MISAAVREILLPIMKEIKNDLNSVKNDLSSLNKTVSNLSGDLEDYKQQTASELAGLQSNVTSELAGLQSNVTSELAGLQSNVTSELAGLQSNVKSQLATIENTTSDLHNSLQSNTQQLAQLCAKTDTLYSKLVSQCTPVPLSSTPTTLISPTSLQPSPTSLPPSPTSLPPSPLFSCGGTGGWRRVVYLNFTDPNTTCPSGWQLTSHSKRTCGKVSTSAFTCDSVTFPVSEGDYTRVCGRIIGYQNEDIEAFYPYTEPTIDGFYVQGVSLTHGSPRQHIWTFAGGFSEVHDRNRNVVCPCDATINITIPPFVGGDYFCESGHNSGPRESIITTFYPDDPLWDGDGCTASSTCCSFNNPPYFTKQLPSPTTDDIEARLCHASPDDTTPVELIELYVQ